MNYSKAIFVTHDNCRALRGTWEADGKTEWFKTFDPNIKVGDICVVPSSTRHKFSTIKITEADASIDLDTNEEVRWIVARIDTASYEAIVEKERQVIDIVRDAETSQRRKALQSAVFANQQEKLAKLPDFTKATVEQSPETKPE